MSTRRVFQSAMVISAMPAMGKSYIASKFPDRIRDLESSEYHWQMTPDGKNFLTDEDGDKILNPEWPLNYIEAIRNLVESKFYDAILVSAHENIRHLMSEHGIKYANVYPEDKKKMRKALIERCIDRGSSADFIDNYEENFSKYVDSMKNDKGSVVNIEIPFKELTEWVNWLFQY